jgi:hypothetical protein
VAPRLLLCLAAVLAAGSLLSGCALVPRANARLEEARAALRDAQADPAVAALAAGELGMARTALAEADVAHDTLDDPAVVDHLAYMARQRAAIARECALQRGWNR